MFGGVKLEKQAWKELIKEVNDNDDGQVFILRLK